MTYGVCHAPVIISEMLPDIHTVENCYFLKPRIHSSIILFSIISANFELCRK